MAPTGSTLFVCLRLYFITKHFRCGKILGQHIVVAWIGNNLDAKLWSLVLKEEQRLKVFGTTYRGEYLDVGGEKCQGAA